MERIDIEGKLLASLYDVLIQINEFKVNSSDSNQLDEEHIGSVSTLAHHDNQLRPGEILESRYTCGNGTHRKFTCEKGKIETCVKDALF